MSAEANPTGHASLSTEPLQFERAEFNQGSALSCAFCKTPVSGQFFQVNGQTSCPNCREQLASAISGGSKPLRAVRAMAAGLGAAVAGFFIYWAVRAITGYEVGLIAILVGFIVGGAIRWGAQSRGGLFYQLMAVVLTYLSIASNYTPDVLQGLRQTQAEETPTASTDAALTTAEPSTPSAAPAPTSSAAVPADDAVGPIPLWFAVPFAFVISLAVPFMGGLNIIGWLIIAFGLMQAWSMNKRVPVEVTGPFDTGNTGGLSPPAPLLQT
jgi:hypothetical protein